MPWSLLFISLIGTCLNAQAQATTHCNTGNLKLSGKKTSQSSDFVSENGVPYTSDRAINGNRDECANTLEVTNSWWSIDLLGVYNSFCISIYNKISTHGDITGAQIHIGNSREDNGTANRKVKTITDFKVDDLNLYQFKPHVSGRYITVFFPESKPAILCDVSITGKVKASNFKLIKKKMIWEDALYYCRDNYRDLASILKEEDQAWAELEAKKADTPSVWLGLHYSCTLDFWFWVSDNAVVFERWQPKKPKVDCYMSGVMMKEENHYWSIRSDYEEFNFICET